MEANEKLTAIADAIREKTGGTEALSLDKMATEIKAIGVGEESYIGTWVIAAEPSINNETDFSVNVKGRAHYYDGTGIVEKPLDAITLRFSEEFGDGYLELRGGESDETIYRTTGDTHWSSNGFAPDDTTLLRTVTLTEEPISPYLRSWLSKNAVQTSSKTDSWYDAFWDAYQNKGTVRDYSCAFGSAWNVEIFKPKYDLLPSNAYMMFRGCAMEIDLVEHLKTCGVTLDLSKATNTQYLFNNSTFTRIGVVDLSGSTSTAPGDSTFSYCRKLKTVDKIIMKTGSRGEFTATAFSYCDALENLTLEGVLTTDIDLHWSTKLSKNSIISVFFAGQNTSFSSTPTFTLSLAAVNKAFETSEGANDGSASEEWQTMMFNASPIYSLV